ncbi:MAG: hypothetical protein AABY15_08510 [Nanoarchaeota archaeon]
MKKRYGKIMDEITLRANSCISDLEMIAKDLESGLSMEIIQKDYMERINPKMNELKQMIDKESAKRMVILDSLQRQMEKIEQIMRMRELLGNRPIKIV